MLAPTAYEARLADLLARVSSGEVSPGDAARELRDLPFSDLGFAKVDHHRELRQGACEIVYAEGKTPEEVRAIVERLLSGNEGPILVSRTSPEHVDAVRAAAAGSPVEIVERPRARCVALRRNVPPPAGAVLIVTAGTSDLGVAEEAELTASLLGAETEIVADVGVAGLHRLAAVQPMLAAADAVVVIAGMEGALASVVGGIAACPGDRLPDERRLRGVARRPGRAAVDALLVRARRRVRERGRRRRRRDHRRDDRSAVRSAMRGPR